MATPTQYNVNSYIKGINGFATLFSNTVYSITLAGATVKTLTVPSSSAAGYANATQTPRFLAVFTYAPNSKVWVANNGTAAVPAGGDFALTTSELNPTGKVVKGGDVLSFICTAGADICVTFYAINEG